MPSTNPLSFPPGVYLPGGANTDPALPADDPTIGNRLNHFCLRIRDPTASLKFYIDLMGMRTVFVLNTGPMTVYYLGYPQTDRHRENLPLFGEETVCQTTMGLLELFHVHGTEEKPEGYYSTGNAPPHLGFSHVGFSVRDVDATMDRLKANGVEVFRLPKGIPISKWESEVQKVGVELEGTDSLTHPDFIKMVAKIGFVKDPDGYLVELLPEKF